MPLVSVIVPNYNHEKFLAQRLNSILNQTFQDFEITILDDCSTDGSINLIETYRHHPKVSQIIMNETNGGTPFRQWSKGIPLARGKYTWIAESDDYAEPALLEKLVEMAEQNENVGIAFCNSRWVDDTGAEGKSLSLYSESFCKKGNDEIKTLLKFNTIQNASATLIRTDLAKQNIAGIERYRSCGDWYLYIQILKKSNVCYTSEILNSFRWYHSNTSNQAQKNDWWITEGLSILRELNTAEIKMERPYLSHVLVYWMVRIKKSCKLSTGAKIKCCTHLLRFYFKFLFSK